MAFDDLEDAVEDQNKEREPDEEPTPKSTDVEPESDDDQGGLDVPAFPYDDVEQTPVYPRAVSRDDFEDALTLEIRPYLTKQGVRNAEKREIHDALFQLAVENPEDLAEIVLNARMTDD